MIKDIIRTFCQKLIGYKNYLFLFSLFTIKRIQSGRHEKEFIFFMGLIPGEGAVLDIGANIGIMTVSLARRFQKVYAFEPIPNNAEALEKVVKHYSLKNVTLFKTALGDSAGELTMILPVVNNAKMQGLSHVVENDDTGITEKGMQYTVPVWKLDDIPELQMENRITAIKIDVENFEYYVLKGGEALLRKHMPLIYCELWNNERRKLCMDYLSGIGYAIHIYDGNKLVPFNGQPVINFFFVPAG